MKPESPQPVSLSNPSWLERLWIGHFAHEVKPRDSLKGAYLPFRIGLEYAIAAAVANHLFAGIQSSPRTDLASMNHAQMVLNAVLLGPLIETLIFQMPFCALARHLKFGFWSTIFVTWLPFCSVHFLVDIPTGLKAGVVLGFYLSFLYVCKRNISLRSAMSWTMFFHVLNNGVFVLLASVF